MRAIWEKGGPLSQSQLAKNSVDNYWKRKDNSGQARGKGGVGIYNFWAMEGEKE